TGDVDRLAVVQVGIPQVVGMGELPQRPVVGMQQDRCRDTLPQLRCDAHMVIVRVRAHDCLDRTPGDEFEDVVDGVWCVDDDALDIVSDHPDVVVDVEGLAVQAERPRRDRVIDARGHQSTTTERRTSPWCIRSNAASTPSRAISSVTNASRSSLPCWYRSTSIGKSRLGRQSPYQLDFRAPPRPKTSIKGISGTVMSGVGTPTRTSTPARSRA